MYKNINTDLVVKYFFVCVIFRIISRTNRGQIIEKWAFSEYKYQFFHLFLWESYAYFFSLVLDYWYWSSKIMISILCHTQGHFKVKKRSKSWEMGFFLSKSTKFIAYFYSNHLHSFFFSVLDKWCWSFSNLLSTLWGIQSYLKVLKGVQKLKYELFFE